MDGSGGFCKQKRIDIFGVISKIDEQVGDDTPKLMCGASVISEDYLLTAGHCAALIKRRGVDQFQILLGTNDLNDTDAVVPELEKIIVHPKCVTSVNSILHSHMNLCSMFQIQF